MDSWRYGKEADASLSNFEKPIPPHQFVRLDKTQRKRFEPNSISTVKFAPGHDRPGLGNPHRKYSPTGHFPSKTCMVGGPLVKLHRLEVG
jgi:hypothetical protein